MELAGALFFKCKVAHGMTRVDPVVRRSRLVVPAVGGRRRNEKSALRWKGAQPRHTPHWSVPVWVSPTGRPHVNKPRPGQLSPLSAPAHFCGKLGHICWVLGPDVHVITRPDQRGACKGRQYSRGVVRKVHELICDWCRNRTGTSRSEVTMNDELQISGYH